MMHQCPYVDVTDSRDGWHSVFLEWYSRSEVSKVSCFWAVMYTSMILLCLRNALISNVQVSLLLLCLLIWYRYTVCDSDVVRQVAGCTTTVFTILLGDQSSNYIGVFILFSILCFFLNCKDSIFQFCFQLRICFVWQSYIYHSIQNLHVYRVLIVLLFVNWGCRGFFDVSLLTFTVITIESQYFFNP